jgi:hypothetical protein
MSAVVVATSPADFHTAEAVEAVEAVKNHHPWLGGALGVQVEALLEAAARGSLPGTASDALVDAIRQATGSVRAAANAQALRSLFESHVVQENEQVLPLLAESSEVSLAVILDGLHEPLGGGQGHSEYAEAAAECGCGGECGCGHQHPSDLDAPWEDPAR